MSVWCVVAFALVEHAATSCVALILPALRRPVSCIILMCALQVWRDLYSITCIIAAVESLQELHDRTGQGSQPDSSASSLQPSQESIALALHELDMAAMMGGPLFRPEVDQLISAAHTMHQLRTSHSRLLPSKRQRTSHVQAQQVDDDSRDDTIGQGQQAEAASAAGAHVKVSKFVQSQASSRSVHLHPQEKAVSEVVLPPDSLCDACKAIPEAHCPSLERYSKLCTRHACVTCRVSGCMRVSMYAPQICSLTLSAHVKAATSLMDNCQESCIAAAATVHLQSLLKRH